MKKALSILLIAITFSSCYEQCPATCYRTVNGNLVPYTCYVPCYDTQEYNK